MGDNLYCQYLVYVHEGLIFFPLMKKQIYYHKEGSIQIKESKTTKTSNWQSQEHKYQHQ